MGRFSLRSRRNEKTWPIQKKGSFPRVGARRSDAARLPSAHELGGSKNEHVVRSIGDEGGIYFSATHFVNWQPARTLSGHFADSSGGKSDKDRIGDMHSRPQGRSGYS